MADERTLLFSLTRKDFEFQYFRAGGKGGQHQNKTSSACRCIHHASGAVGVARDERQQWQNRKLAFRRMAESDKFQKWLRIEMGIVVGASDRAEKQLNEWMKPEHIRVEVKKNGRWVPLLSDSSETVNSDGGKMEETHGEGESRD